VSEWLFNGWQDVIRIVVVGIVVYVALLGILRLSGKRTLAKMNAFDFVVTVALGSTLATALLSERVPATAAIVALALLVALQFVVSWLSVRSGVFERFVKSDATLLLYRGEMDRVAMRKMRVSEGEIRACLRKAGVSGYDVEAVVLETDGTFSVVKTFAQDTSAMKDVLGFDDAHRPDAGTEGAERPERPQEM
jgi:uncharacterized membrane protein YcaP (DUF421 family)